MTHICDSCMSSSTCALHHAAAAVAPLRHSDGSIRRTAAFPSFSAAIAVLSVSPAPTPHWNRTLPATRRPTQIPHTAAQPSCLPNLPQLSVCRPQFAWHHSSVIIHVQRCAPLRMGFCVRVTTVTAGLSTRYTSSDGFHRCPVLVYPQRVVPMFHSSASLSRLCAE